MTDSCLQVEDWKLSDGNASTCVIQDPVKDDKLAETTVRVTAHQDCFVDKMIVINITLGTVDVSGNKPINANQICLEKELSRHKIA